MESLRIERALQNRLAEAGGADDLIGRVGADLHPVAFGVDEVELVGGIAGHLAADQGVGVELEFGAAQGFAVLFGDAAHLLGVEVDDFEEALAGHGVAGEGVLEVEQDLVARGAQAGVHDEEREAGALIGGGFSRDEAFVAGDDARVGNAYQALIDGDSEAESHALSVHAPSAGRERPLREKVAGDAFIDCIHFRLHGVAEFVEARRRGCVPTLAKSSSLRKHSHALFAGAGEGADGSAGDEVQAAVGKAMQ